MTFSVRNRKNFHTLVFNAPSEGLVSEFCNGSGVQKTKIDAAAERQKSGMICALNYTHLCTLMSIMRTPVQVLYLRYIDSRS